jgi:hypothetical protein
LLPCPLLLTRQEDLHSPQLSTRNHGQHELIVFGLLAVFVLLAVAVVSRGLRAHMKAQGMTDERIDQFGSHVSENVIFYSA